MNDNIPLQPYNRLTRLGSQIHKMDALCFRAQFCIDAAILGQEATWVIGGVTSQTQYWSLNLEVCSTAHDQLCLAALIHRARLLLQHIGIWYMPAGRITAPCEVYSFIASSSCVIPHWTALMVSNFWSSSRLFLNDMEYLEHRAELDRILTYQDSLKYFYLMHFTLSWISPWIAGDSQLHCPWFLSVWFAL